jgi:hypothetical protein
MDDTELSQYHTNPLQNIVLEVPAKRTQVTRSNILNNSEASIKLRFT